MRKTSVDLTASIERAKDAVLAYFAWRAASGLWGGHAKPEVTKHRRNYRIEVADYLRHYKGRFAFRVALEPISRNDVGCHIIIKGWRKPVIFGGKRRNGRTEATLLRQVRRYLDGKPFSSSIEETLYGSIDDYAY